MEGLKNMKHKNRNNKIILKKKIWMYVLAVTIAVNTIGMTGCKKGGEITLINVSYDPTRALYEEYNQYFAKVWKEKNGQKIMFVQSHGGSGTQASSVINGLKADVVTLALESDIEKISEDGLIDLGWQEELDNNSAPYTSTIVFLVRKSNPKHIKDWSDLIRADVSVITPNPKTSGGAKWNYLAALAYAKEIYGDDEKKSLEFMRALYGNVLSLASGARGATSSFVEDRQGDVLIAWENEALQAVNDNPGEYEIITPSVSILAEPCVSVVDYVVEQNGHEEVAEEYLKYLYTDEAQRIIARNFFRPVNLAILEEYNDTFCTDLKMVTIRDFGGWDKVNEKHFSNGGTFDQIYEK